jgi:phosphoribosylformylglycinamidine synthase subunit PurQ / glutaminase
VSVDKIPRSKKPVAVVRFLGTNCDQDVFNAVVEVGLKPEWVWYDDLFDWKSYGAILLPGGFSYGDYLRSGSLAARAQVMKSVREAAHKGVPVLGICNGFQILCESGLLPGVLVQNDNLRFVDRWEEITLKGPSPYFAGNLRDRVRLPVAHGDGRFFIEEDGVKRLFDEERVWWCYESNPNGSLENIAGVLNESGNVAGLMPHPERAMNDWMGGTDGRVFFETLLAN